MACCKQPYLILPDDSAGLLVYAGPWPNEEPEGDDLMSVQSKMSVERTQATMTAYFQDLLGGGRYARHFSDDLVVTLMWTDQVLKRRDAAQQMINYLHQQAFAARPVLKNSLVGEGQAVAEADFVGKRSGEFAGVAASGKDVNMPYCVAYDLNEDKITALRLYFPVRVLLQQIGAK
jgi:predicted ester cyclase